MSDLRIFFGLLALVAVVQAFSLRDRRRAQDWPAASSASSSSAGGLGGPITKSHSHVIDHGKADATGAAQGFGPNQYFSGQGTPGSPYLPGSPNVSGNNWGLGGYPVPGQNPMGTYPQPGPPQGSGYPYGGSSGATATANSNRGNAITTANVGAGNQYPGGTGIVPYTQGLANYNLVGQGGGIANANAIANAYGGGNANANAVANGFGANANAIANANAGIGDGFQGSFFSRVGEDADEDNKKIEGIVEGAKGVFSTSHASLDGEGKGKFEVTAGKIPE